MDFSKALCELKAGKAMRRAGWNGKHNFIMVQYPDEYSKMTEPYIYMHTEQGGCIPWLASQADLFGIDWIEA